MQREILQEKSLSRSQGNAEKSLNVDLSAKSRLIPYSTAADMLSLNDLYLEERDACENYRMIFTVNPVCTNVLFNAVTEPVWREGSEDAVNLVQGYVERGDISVFPNGVINQSGKTGDDRTPYDPNPSGKKVDQVMAVRDTEFSHELIGNFKYHCGYDIFNNHLLRTEDFQHIQLGKKRLIGDDKYGNFSNEKVFNTIYDRMIDYDGNRVRRIMDFPEGSAITIDSQVSPTKATQATRIINLLGTLKKDANVYQLDNIKTMNLAFYDSMRVVDGWYGFYNTGYINIPNTKIPIYEPDPKKQQEVLLNHILNNETSCGFIDMYPDRTLYSFIPKVNRFRKRLERNWDCTIVYPYENDYDTFALVNQNEIDAVRILNATITYNNVGEQMIRMKSLMRHTLQPGDEIRVFYKKKADEWDPENKKTGDGDCFSRFPIPVQVVSVGDSKGNDANRFFSIRLRDIETFCGINEEGKLVLLNDKGEAKGVEIAFFYRKIDGGYDNKYYFRKFKKIKNFEYVAIEEGEEPEEEPVNVVKEPQVITDDSPRYIKFEGNVYEKKSHELAYTQNKIAFGENIYGDRIAQVIFDNDICTSGLKDNLGRPLSTVYFTVVKTNRGHKEWYDSGVTSAKTVEFSHCFGEVNSGLDMPTDSACTNFNVRKLHSVFIDKLVNAEYASGLTKIMSGAPVGEEDFNYNGTPKPLEIDIKIDNPFNEEEERLDELFGDVVEFCASKFQETPIEKVYHRFNTAQRECVQNSKYFDIHYDEIIGDQHDITSAGTPVELSGSGGTDIVQQILNVLPPEDEETEEMKFPGNISPEGYYYSPFYPVMLKELDDELQWVKTRVINYSPDTVSTGTTEREYYDPQKGIYITKTLYTITVTSPLKYDFIANQPFSIYDVYGEKTYRGYLDKIENKTILTIVSTENFLPKEDEPRVVEDNKNRYIVALNLENSPEYAEYIPATQKVVWRAPKKMSKLTNESPIYNMPFTNGRLYVHSNVNVFLKRQDPTGDYMLFRPAQANPLQRFKVEGQPQLDFDYINYITDTMLEPC